MLSDHRTPERLLNGHLRVEPQAPCSLPSSPGAAPSTTTGKINEKVLFKLPRGSAVPLWVYLKTLQAAAVHNNKSVGEREERQEEERGGRSRDGEGRRREGGQEHPGLFLVKN